MLENILSSIKKTAVIGLAGLALFSCDKPNSEMDNQASTNSTNSTNFNNVQAKQTEHEVIEVQDFDYGLRRITFENPKISSFVVYKEDLERTEDESTDMPVAGVYDREGNLLVNISAWEKLFTSGNLAVLPGEVKIRYRGYGTSKWSDKEVVSQEDLEQLKNEAGLENMEVYYDPEDGESRIITVNRNRLDELIQERFERVRNQGIVVDVERDKQEIIGVVTNYWNAIYSKDYETAAQYCIGREREVLQSQGIIKEWESVISKLTKKSYEFGAIATGTNMRNLYRTPTKMKEIQEINGKLDLKLKPYNFHLFSVLETAPLNQDEVFLNYTIFLHKVDHKEWKIIQGMGLSGQPNIENQFMLHDLEANNVSPANRVVIK